MINLNDKKSGKITLSDVEKFVIEFETKLDMSSVIDDDDYANEILTSFLMMSERLELLSKKFHELAERMKKEK